MARPATPRQSPCASGARCPATGFAGCRGPRRGGASISPPHGPVWPDARPVPRRRRDQPRRDGRGLPGYRHASQPRRRAQGPARRPGPRCRSPATVRAGGPGRLSDRAPEHRRHLRRERGRRAHVHRDGTRPRREDERLAGPGPAAGDPGAGRGRRDRVGAGAGARPADRPPRSEARQRDAHRRGPRQGHRLRHRQADRAGRRIGPRHAHQRHRRGSGGGHHDLHVARAGPRRPRRLPQRHLLVRHRAARDAGGTAAVPGQERHRDGERHPARAGAASAGARAGHRARRRRRHPAHRRQVPGKGPGRALSEHEGPRRRSARRPAPAGDRDASLDAARPAVASSQRRPRWLCQPQPPPVSCWPRRRARGSGSARARGSRRWQPGRREAIGGSALLRQLHRRPVPRLDAHRHHRHGGDRPVAVDPGRGRQHRAPLRHPRRDEPRRRQGDVARRHPRRRRAHRRRQRRRRQLRAIRRGAAHQHAAAGGDDRPHCQLRARRRAECGEPVPDGRRPVAAHPRALRRGARRRRADRFAADVAGCHRRSDARSRG